MTIYYSTFARLVENYTRHPNSPNKPVIKDELKNANCDANKNGICLDVIITTANLGGLELRLKKDSIGDFDFDEVNYQDPAGKTHFYVNDSPRTLFVGSSWFDYSIITRKNDIDLAIKVKGRKLTVSIHKDSSGHYHVSEANFYDKRNRIISIYKRPPPKKKAPATPPASSAGSKAKAP
jgi:hypothetical protein